MRLEILTEEKSMEVFLRGLLPRILPDGFVLDSNDCIQLKEKLKRLCSAEVPCLVRIACRELENWYLGDFIAIERVFPEVKAANYSARAKYRITDKLTGSEELKRISQRFSKIQTAREIAKYIEFEGNNSVSFNHFIKGLRKLIT